MLKVSLTVTLQGKDVELTYDEGRELFQELSSLYKPANTSIERSPFDDLADDTNSCSYTAFDKGVNTDANESKCESGDITVSTAAQIKDTDHLGGDLDDPAFKKEVDDKIAERVAKMQDIISDLTQSEE